MQCRCTVNLVPCKVISSVSGVNKVDSPSLTMTAYMALVKVLLAAAFPKRSNGDEDKM